MKNFVFFTLNDFSKDGGGTVRMKGVLNALSEKNEVVLISNATDISKFNKNIKHIVLNLPFNKKDKRFFQFCLSWCPNFINKILFRKLLISLKQKLKENDIKSDVIFFEYLDNSIGYFLWKNKIIENYINDTHGIALIEFKYKNNFSIKEKFKNYLKYLSALQLDKKILKNFTSLIVVSNAMKNYFLKEYDFLKNKNIFVLRDGVNESLCKKVPDLNKVKEFKHRYKINENDKVMFFAGNFKDLGGVYDLVQAFEILVNKKNHNNYKLFLIGDGERFDDCKNFVKKYNIENKVIFAGRVSYEDLRNYQELADVIVCPDKKHPYSELVPHIKYFDSLASGKIVINGNFEVIKEINKDEKLSINFEPSNIQDLANKIEIVIENLKFYKEKYKNVKSYICGNFTYNSLIKDFLKEYNK